MVRISGCRIIIYRGPVGICGWTTSAWNFSGDHVLCELWSTDLYKQENP